MFVTDTQTDVLGLPNLGKIKVRHFPWKFMEINRDFFKLKVGDKDIDGKTYHSIP